jgi:tripartite ATP-independent transporter DctM subunit
MTTAFSVAVAGFVALLTLFLLRMPVAFVMALVGLGGFSYMVSTGAGIALAVKDLWGMFSNAELTVVPMFVLMGSLAFYSGISSKLYDATNRFLGQKHGGLAMATILACAAFAAICGSTNASAAAMGKVTIPEMKRYKYSSSLAAGCVGAGGTLGILIPPSAMFIIYGVITEQSIGKLFASGIFPGILLTILFIVTIFIICRVRPSLAPPGPRTTWRQKVSSLSGIIEPMALFALVMGGLFIGWFTPMEAGAVGAGGTLLMVIVMRQITWRGFIDALGDTTRITCMIFVIITGAVIFGRFMAITRVPFQLTAWVGNLALSPNVIMIFIVFGYLIGGCFMDSLALVTLTVPILLPVILELGFDPIWFGVVIVLVTEVGVITPPVGINVYVIKGVAPDIPLGAIFRGIVPFLIPIILTIVTVFLFPALALFLPELL